MSNSMIYKYKVGRKWFSFDKSVLQPEDLQIFDKADWTDKLKIIMIYKDLKENEDDTVNVLSFKKENANKDKRKIEYANKKEKIMNNIKELNTKAQTPQTEKEIEKLQKELKDLEIEYADVVNINTANTLNVSNVNTLNLNNIEKIKSSIQETEKKFEEVKNLLSADDITKIKEIFENLKSSNDVEEFKKVISELKADLLQNLPKSLAIDFENLENKIDSLSGDISEISTIIKQKNLDSIVNAMKSINPKDISDELYENIEDAFNLSAVMEFYESYIAKDMVYYSTGKNQYYKLTYEILNARFSPFEISNQNTRSNQKTTKTFYFEEDGEKEEFEEVPDNFYLINTDIKTDPTKAISYPLFEILHSIYSNHKKASGFLGLKTNKEARKENDRINAKLDEVFKAIRELKADITNIKQEIEVLRASQTVKNVELREAALPRDAYASTKPKIISEELQTVKLRRPQTQPPQPQQKREKSFEPTTSADALASSLKEIMNIRRKDIEPDEYTDESDEWIAAGVGEEDVDVIAENVGVMPIGGASLNKIKLAGSLLEELKDDLKNYGLALNFNIYKKRRAKDVKSSSKQEGKGFVEAKKINDSITKSSNYTDLKELYEDLYEDA